MARRTEFMCGSRHRIMFNQFVTALLFLGLPLAKSRVDKFYVNVTDLNLLVAEERLFELVQIGEYNETLDVTIIAQHTDIVQFVPPSVRILGVQNPNSIVKLSYDIYATGKSPGHSDVHFNVTPSGIVNLDALFMLVTVMHSHAIFIISNIIGWIYFAAWSISFYPQIYYNYERKSVEGLSFDFLALNLMSFSLYTLFNCELYFSEKIQAEYFARHPRSLNPVQLNDVFFSLHATCATMFTIIQCFIYKHKDQRLSIVGRGLLGVGGVVVLVTASLGGLGLLAWLDFLYCCSYIKLTITLIKYMPQAYMNYKRQSTEGWSIGNVVLDFLGGFFSILQMTLNAYNYNDWISFFGDATKFGLGLFSLVFDVFFILQHYVFYRVPVIIKNPTVKFRSAIRQNLDTISSQIFEGETVTNENRSFIKHCVSNIHEFTERFFKEMEMFKRIDIQFGNKCTATQTEFKPYEDGSTEIKTKNDSDATTVNTQTQTDLPTGKNTTIADTAAIIRDTIREEFRRLTEPAAALFSGAPKTSSETRPGSYVSAGSRTNTSDLFTPLKEPAIIINNKEVRTPAETLETTVFAPVSNKLVSNNKVCFELDNVSQSDTALDKIKTYPLVAAEESNTLNPMIIPKGISVDSPANQLVDLIQQNITIGSTVRNSNDLKLHFETGNRDPQLHNIAQVQINVDHQRIHAGKYAPLLQCISCLQYGQTRKRCSSRNSICSHGALPEYEFKNNSEKFKCHNCSFCYNNNYINNFICKHSTSFTEFSQKSAIEQNFKEKVDNAF